MSYRCIVFSQRCYKEDLKNLAIRVYWIEFSIETEYWRNISILQQSSKYLWQKGNYVNSTTKIDWFLLRCNLSLKRCKIRPTIHCNYCKHDVENMRYLIFDFETVMEIWYKTSIILDVVIQWGHIILGFFYESNSLSEWTDFFIALEIYKYWMTCIYNKTIKDKTGLLLYVKMHYYTLYYMLKLLV